jgi:uncharacterized protein DUF5677
MSMNEWISSTLEKALQDAFDGRSDEEVEKFVNSGALESVVDKTIPTVAATLVDGLMSGAPEMLVHRRSVEATIAEQVRRTYGRGIDLCEAILKIASECGEEYVELQFGDHPDGSVPAIPWVIAHLQARACRIAEEALLLARHGYGLGAYARWRSLHEVVVVGAFIKEHGQETAVRYVEHLMVDRWRLLVALSESGRIDNEDRDALAEAQASVDQLVAKYGASFRDEYGWASDALPKNGHGGFRAIEVATEFGHLRIDYRQASAGVHACAGMVLEPPDAMHLGSTLVTGPALVAIATPASAVALSLVVCTGTLLTSSDNTATAYVLSAMLALYERATDLLGDAEAEVERRDETARERAVEGNGPSK